MGLFVFEVVDMHISRLSLGLATACMGLSLAAARTAEVFKGFTSVMRFYKPCVWSQPSRYKSKPNRISQAKRRKYKRQGR